MTSKMKRPETADGELEMFPEFPPRYDMQNILHLHIAGYMTTLSRHFGSPESTLVLGEVPVYPRPSRNARVPDLIVAFNVNPATVVAQMGYAIEVQGKPPDFALEVASVTTALNDYTRKRDDYAAFGIPEYWRFDPTGGRRYDVPLAGDRLVGNAYQPIEIISAADGRLWGHSDILNLDLCWENGELRWWDPVAARYLETHAEEANARWVAETLAETERAARLAERAARLAAESLAETERASRLAAEARIRQLEEEQRRRQDP